MTDASRLPTYKEVAKAMNTFHVERDAALARAERAERKVAMLCEELVGWVIQHGCTCGHPAHKLDRETQSANELLATINPEPSEETKQI